MREIVERPIVHSPIHLGRTLGVQKESVIVIDDSPDALLLQRIMLENEGFKVFTAESGREALLILSQIDEPNLILLDMQMEGMNGSEFLKVLEKESPNIVRDVPVVFLTGMDKVPKSKAVGFIRKPIDMSKFLKNVHSYIRDGKKAS